MTGKTTAAEQTPDSATRAQRRANGLLSAADVLAVQRSAGNRAAQRLILQRQVQAKLTVGPVDDAYEREADRMADAVMSSPSPLGGEGRGEGAAQREPTPEDDELQMKSLAAQITPLAQREVLPEEEELQAKPVGSGEAAASGQASTITQPAASPALAQREAMPEEEELQAKRIQREAMPEDEELQAKRLQREAMPEEDELAQTKRVQRRRRGKAAASSLAKSHTQPAALPLPAASAHRKANSDGSFEAGADVEQRIARSRGGGSALPSATRAEMEAKFGADFGGVRLHTGGESSQLNRDLSAQAFTHGSDVYFGEGKYAPGSGDGKRLLAHELTHVVQQQSVACSTKLGTKKEPSLLEGELQLDPKLIEDVRSHIKTLVRQQMVGALLQLPMSELSRIPGVGVSVSGNENKNPLSVQPPARQESGKQSSSLTSEATADWRKIDPNARTVILLLATQFAGFATDRMPDSVLRDVGEKLLNKRRTSRLPGIPWLGVEINGQDGAFMIGIHFDLGNLTKSLEFGPVKFEDIGGVPKPEPDTNLLKKEPLPEVKRKVDRSMRVKGDTPDLSFGQGRRLSAHKLQNRGGIQRKDSPRQKPVEIYHPTELVPQPDGHSCWSAAGTMIVGNMSLDVDANMKNAKGELLINSIDKFASLYGLKVQPQQSYSIQGLVELLSKGPIWVGGLVPTGHAFVIAGIRGNGTTRGTNLIQYDPWPPSQGAIREINYVGFMKKYPLAMMVVLQK
jgi:hypothetical protein